MKTARIAGVLAVFLGVLACMSGRAEAATVTVQNDSDTEVLMVFMFHDTGRNYFYVKGWYRVPAGKRLYWNFDIASNKNFYWYGRAVSGQDRRWPGTGQRKQAVVDKAMDFKYDEVRDQPGAYDVEFAVRQPNREGNIAINLVN